MILVSSARKVKDPNAKKDYTFPLAAWLAGDTISDVVWLIDDAIVDPANYGSPGPTGLTIEGAPLAPSFDDTTAKVWLSGGALTKVYAVTCRVTTAAGRQDDATGHLLIAQQ